MKKEPLLGILIFLLIFFSVLAFKTVFWISALLKLWGII